MTAVSYQDSPGARQGLSQVRAPLPAEWDGISHGRMTRRMIQAGLPPAARVVMAEIFRCIPIGSWRHISHDTLRRRLGISESTVSRAMALLAAEAVDAGGHLINRTPFIARRRRQGGQGYEICPLPPPEMRPRPAPTLPPTEEPPEPAAVTQTGFFFASTGDPGHAIPLQAVPTPQTDAHKGSLSDPCIFLDHACSGSKHGDRPEDAKPDRATQPAPAAPTEPAPTPSTRADLPPTPPAQFAALGIRHVYQWRALCQAAPAGYGLAELARDLLKLRSRPDVVRPIWLLRRLLERNEPVYSLAEIEAHNAELAALAGRTPAKEAPHDPTPPPAPAGEPLAAPRRPADAPPGRAARVGRGRPAEPAQPPPLSREEWEASPLVDAAALGLPLPRYRQPARGPGDGDGGPADHRGPLRE